VSASFVSLFFLEELFQKRHCFVFSEELGVSTDGTLSSEFILLYPPNGVEGVERMRRPHPLVNQTPKDAPPRIFSLL
jgi:hypothetical protein